MSVGVRYASSAQLGERGVWMFGHPKRQIKRVHSLDIEQEHSCGRMVNGRVQQGLWVKLLGSR
jgi:hypothetical protein